MSFPVFILHSSFLFHEMTLCPALWSSIKTFIFYKNWFVGLFTCFKHQSFIKYMPYNKFLQFEVYLCFIYGIFWYTEVLNLNHSSLWILSFMIYSLRCGHFVYFFCSFQEYCTISSGEINEICHSEACPYKMWN